MANGAQSLDVDGRDIDLEQLTPLNERQVNLAKNAGFRKIMASVQAIGLVEPLSVFPENGGYVILDGFLRYTACKELGIRTVPCLVYKDKQAYTFNRNVNRLSAYQEIRMLRKSLETIDEPTIARTFGMKSIKSRLVPTLIKQLHPDVVAAFKENVVSKACARELLRVTHERQVEILKEMTNVGDFSPAFCRALVIQTPASQRNKSKPQRQAWADDGDRKRDMMARLDHAQRQHDFYSCLYRQYSADLLKLVFHVRKMISIPEIEAYLETNHAEVLGRFKTVIESG
ncbi:MAG: ParB N-terminal domain-containing protein [Phycisphaerae bacterium]|nr:ParB N-terminal domain-containing protein [Phycisphaerae bacterium]